MKKTLILMLCFLAFKAMLIAQNYSGGSGTSDDPYQIANTTDIIYLSMNSSDWDKFFIQTAEIAFNIDEAMVDWEGDGSPDGSPTEGFSPIGNSSINFTGSFNGDGYSIDNLYINQSATDYIGLFGYLDDADIDGVNLNDVNITGNDQTGALSGRIDYGAIDDCFVSGAVMGEKNSGGLVGDVRYRAVIHNCGADVTVSGEYNVGGFAGRNFSIDYRLINK